MSTKQDSQTERSWWMRYYEHHCASLDVVPPKDLTNVLYLRGKTPREAAALAKELNELPADQWLDVLRGGTPQVEAKTDTPKRTRKKKEPVNGS